MKIRYKIICQLYTHNHVSVNSEAPCGSLNQSPVAVGLNLATHQNYLGSSKNKQKPWFWVPSFRIFKSFLDEYLDMQEVFNFLIFIYLFFFFTMAYKSWLLLALKVIVKYEGISWAGQILVAWNCPWKLYLQQWKWAKAMDQGFGRN